jgi:large conductance mechanosensitive channel
LTFSINGSRFLYGAFFNALIAFVVIAAVIFFLVVKPVNALMKRYKAEPPVDEPVRQCPHCLSEIPVAASRCAFCTQEVAGGTVTA